MNTASTDQGRARGVVLTVLAMLCFAANSVLCRLALGPHLIDPASFTAVRVVSAAAVLAIIVALSGRPLARVAVPRWKSIGALLAYLVFFSFAYTRLTTGTGALILFGTVQLTMFAVALYQGERFPVLSWLGLGLAFAGLIYLVLPGLAAPDPRGAVYMAIAGIAWGLFSLLARGVEYPAEANASNFLYCVPLVALVSVVTSDSFDVTPSGLALAAASGIVASGIGYTIWYAALRYLSGTKAATVQLSVPAIAAFGGVLLLSEPVTARLVVASCALLGGAAIVIGRRAPPQPAKAGALPKSGVA
jgi:drug/metabolite transporter (DMT)-like permease